MSECKTEFEWVSITDESKIREAVWELKEAGIGDRNDLVSHGLYFLNISETTSTLQKMVNADIKERSQKVIRKPEYVANSDKLYEALQKAAAAQATNHGEIKHAHVFQGIVTTQKILKDYGFEFTKIEGQDRQMRAVLRP